MSGTLNITFKIQGVVDGVYYEFGDIYGPTTISTSADVVLPGNTVAVTAAGTGQQVASFSAAPALVAIYTEVAGSLSWGGATGADNSSVNLRAGSIFFIPTGVTTVDAASAELRSEAADADITQVWFDADSDGHVRVFAAR